MTGRASYPVPAAIRATPAERAVAEAVMAAVPGGPSGLLFGRVDLVPGPGGPMVLEVELLEPVLFLDLCDGGVERLAAAVAAALDAS